MGEGTAGLLAEIEQLAHVHGVESFRGLLGERRRDIGEIEVVTVALAQGVDLVEIADALGVSLSTVNSDWRVAKLWLRRALSADG